jgi:hypothetical protein
MVLWRNKIVLLCAVWWTAAIGLGCARSYTSTDSDGSVHKKDGTSPGTLQIGEACTASQDCESGLCLSVGSEFLCSVECGNCPPSTYCARVEPEAAPPGETAPPDGYYCLPDRGGLCKPCASDINCTFPGDRCLDLGAGEMVCGRDCSYDQTCPVGYECVSNQCHPLGGTCDCTTERVGVTRRCEVSNEYGTCYGEETCAQSGWEGCDAKTPGPEVCNGEDDDCDGVVPNDELDNDNNGTIDCIENCEPEPEVCDLVDNDCDLEVDNGDPVEMCGTIDHGTPACVVGECVVGQCDPGFADIDGQLSNGCECALAESGGPTCSDAEDLGSLDDTGQTLTVSGVLGDGGEVWYRIEALDLPDNQTLADTFHFRIQFVTNPDTSYKMDVIAEDCQQAPVCPQSITDFQWYTNFRDGQGESAIGEGACMEDPTVDGEGYNECTDNGNVYYVRVFKVNGSPVSCNAYEIELTNGIYSP